MGKVRSDGTADGSKRASRELQSEADIQLLVRMRRTEPAALRLFCTRFRLPLMNWAGRLGVPQNDREEVVMSFLDDMIMKLMTMRAPRSLPTFVITAFCNHVSDARRDAAVRTRRDERESEAVGSEHAVASLCSEYSLRAVRGADSDSDTGATSMVALLTRVLEPYTQDERMLLIWLSHRIPLRDIAHWLGITYETAKKRATRLKSRVARDTIAALGAADAEERATVARVLRRAGIDLLESTNHDPNHGADGGAAA